MTLKMQSLGRFKSLTYHGVLSQCPTCSNNGLNLERLCLSQLFAQFSVSLSLYIYIYVAHAQSVVSTMGTDWQLARALFASADSLLSRSTLSSAEQEQALVFEGHLARSSCSTFSTTSVAKTLFCESRFTLGRFDGVSATTNGFIDLVFRGPRTHDNQRQSSQKFSRCSGCLVGKIGQSWRGQKALVIKLSVDGLKLQISVPYLGNMSPHIQQLASPRESET